MNEPITPDQESVMIARLTNKLNQILSQLTDNKLFPQVDAKAREMLQDRLKEAYTFADRILSQLKEFKKEEPEFKLNLHESTLCKVVERTKDLIGVLADYQNELTDRFNRDNRDRAWAVDVAEWFCREMNERFHVTVIPDHSAIYNAKSPSLIVKLDGQPIPCIKHFALHIDRAAHKVRIEAHTDLDYTEDNIKRLRINNGSKVLQATKNGNGKLVLYTSYTPHPSQNSVEQFQRLTVRLELIKVHIRALLLEEVA